MSKLIIVFFTSIFLVLPKLSDAMAQPASHARGVSEPGLSEPASRINNSPDQLRRTAIKTAGSPVSRSHYVEFRAAEIGTYGHSYIAYGRLDPRGKPADTHYADLHPMGNYLIMAVGHILPVPANTSWDPDVLKLPVSSKYRRDLNAADYNRLVSAIEKTRANKNPVWNAVSNNCNHFVAELAKSIGLKTPNDFQFSYTFVPALRDINELKSEPHPSR